MSNPIAFCGSHGIVQVALPFDLDGIMAGWKRIRAAMLKQSPPEFTRDEWAYLASFLSEENLRRPFLESYGQGAERAAVPSLLARPRGPVGLWLPNNVSLLGPLMLIVVSLSGCPLRMKAGSRSVDLTGIFLSFAQKHAYGPLACYLDEHVRHEVFSADDDRNREMAEVSAVRIVFGSDDAGRAVNALPHPADSIAISFSDRRSEAWVDRDCCDDSTLRDLIRVFSIFGQAGCTSPSRVILLNASRAHSLKVRDRLAALWPSVIRRLPEMNVASDNVRACHVARAAGWDSKLVPENRAVISVGDHALPASPSLMELRLITAGLQEALHQLPENIHTIGHAMRNPTSSEWFDRLARTKVVRFVPIAKMHHFETLWDGQDFFARLFAWTRVQA